MIYMGSKARFAKHIAPIVNTALGNSSGILYEPFCGGCNLTPHFKGKVIANDINENLIELFKDAIKGMAFPTYVSREMYNEAKNGQLDKALTAYIGFCSSYNGRYFEGYVGNDHPIANGKTRNYQQEAIKNFLSTVERLRAMESLELTSVPYYEMEIENNSIVYCDPPYIDSKGYKTSAFDHKKFWEWADTTARNNVVFVSEYTTLSASIIPVWEAEAKVTIGRTKKKTTEKLFMYI